ncbi:MAG: hypothetical protein K2K18_02580, partial [Malacoplasma sp.]|nr:hypothetical protein [Malacoplasma sp.]
ILNSIEEDKKEENKHHFECVCEDKTEGDLEMSDDKNKETSFIDNEAIAEFESINTDLDTTNKLNSVENIFEEDINTENKDLNALINENEYEQIFSDLSNLNNENNFEFNSETNSINDNDLITAEELEKILSSDDEFNKSLFVDDEKNMSESFDDEEYVSDEPFNFENFFTEITNKDSEEISLNSEKEHENNNDIFSTNEINLDGLLKFNEKDIPTELETEDFNFSNDLNNIDNEISSLDLTDWNKDVISNNEEKIDTNAVKNEINENLDTDLLDLKIEDWNQHQNLNLDETTETISLVKDSTNTEDLEALNDLDWNKKIPNEIQEFSFEKEISQQETNKNNTLENWSEFISASESLPKSDNKNIENLENLSLADEIKEFFENGEIEESNFDISDIQNAEPEFILPIENKEEDSIVESIVVDNQINENEDSKDFFVNFDPPVEK